MTYAAVDDLLQRLGLVQDAAEFHGALCGRLCAVAEGEMDEVAGQPLLQALRDQSLHDLKDIGAGFQPLLPEDDAELSGRVEALAQWCAGFVFGLGSVPGFDLSALSGDAREMVSDMTEISRAETAPRDDAESDEEAYAEILEYVRVGAQLVFMETRSLLGGQSGPTLH